jgi:hypothetical protein
MTRCSEADVRDASQITLGDTRTTATNEPSVQTADSASAAAPLTDQRPHEPMAVRIAARALPQGWLWKESVTFLHPQGTANLIASSEPLADGIDAESYASSQGALLESEFPDYEQYALEPRRVFDLDGYLRVFEWTPPGQDRIAQLQVYAVRGMRGFTATATTPAHLVDETEAELLQLLDGLTLFDVMQEDADGPS